MLMVIVATTCKTIILSLRATRQYEHAGGIQTNLNFRNFAMEHEEDECDIFLIFVTVVIVNSH
jgi:hypothetical protein